MEEVTEKTQAITDCTKCVSHSIINDADPDDWFLDDDVAVVCQLTINDKKDLNSRHPADRSDFKSIIVGERPYKVKTVNAPKWCPKNK